MCLKKDKKVEKSTVMLSRITRCDQFLPNIGKPYVFGLTISLYIFPVSGSISMGALEHVLLLTISSLATDRQYSPGGGSRISQRFTSVSFPYMSCW